FRVIQQQGGVAVNPPKYFRKLNWIFRIGAVYKCPGMNRDQQKQKRIQGYTLAEMAICLCIIGILMSGALTGAGRYFEAQKTGERNRHLDAVMNVRGATAKPHNRLPCPADPKAEPKRAGVERDKCHDSNEGILPWKELAIPQSLTLDAWGNAITY